MKLKEFYQPSKYKVIGFIIVFILIFIIPYLKPEPTPGAEQLLTAGRYPLIYIFLMSLVVIIDLMSGNFVLGDFILFIVFLLSFFLLYTAVCGVVHLISKRKRPQKPAEKNISAPQGKPAPDRFVVHLEDKE